MYGAHLVVMAHFVGLFAKWYYKRKNGNLVYDTKRKEEIQKLLKQKSIK